MATRTRKSSMATALKDADNIIQEQADVIQEAIDRIEKKMRPYDKLKEKRDRLRSAQRALLGGNKITGEGGSRLTQEEIVAYLGENPGARPVDIAKHFDVPQPTISSHLYRGKDSRFLTKDKRWYNRDPEAGLNTADDIEED